MAWRTHPLEMQTGQHKRPQLPNTNKCDADRRTTVVLGVCSRDAGRGERGQAWRWGPQSGATLEQASSGVH